MNNARQLLTSEQFEAVTGTVLRANRATGMTTELAARITEEGIKFVAAAAAQGGRGLRPSRIVDEGWHALILHTRIYRGLCTRLGGFIDHLPEPPDPSRHDPGALIRTQDAIRQAGYEPDEMLWLAPTDTSLVTVGADCEHGPTGPEGTCTESCSPSGPN